MKIGDFDISQNRTFIIAEIGNNHNGDFDRAKLMIDKAVEMGADCAKFQMRQIKEVYRSKSLDKSGEDLGTEYIIDLLNKFANFMIVLTKFLSKVSDNKMLFDKQKVFKLDFKILINIIFFSI